MSFADAGDEPVKRVREGWEIRWLQSQRSRKRLKAARAVQPFPTPKIMNIRSGHCLYAWEDGEVAGHLDYFPEWRGQPAYFVVRTTPKFRRRGVATRLLQEALQRWPIDLAKQFYSSDGLKFINEFRRTQSGDRRGKN